MSKPSPIPAGYHTVTPYLIVKGAEKALEFYRRAFGAEETLRLAMPNGALAHAEIKIGDSVVMLADEHPEWGAVGPQTVGGTPLSLLLNVEDVDATFSRAIASGAKEIRPVTNQFYGDRSGLLEDPFGHRWSVASHVEDVSPEEIERRFNEMPRGEPVPEGN